MPGDDQRGEALTDTSPATRPDPVSPDHEGPSSWSEHAGNGDVYGVRHPQLRTPARGGTAVSEIVNESTAAGGAGP